MIFCWNYILCGPIKSSSKRNVIAHIFTYIHIYHRVKYNRPGKKRTIKKSLKISLIVVSIKIEVAYTTYICIPKKNQEVNNKVNI